MKNAVKVGVCLLGAGVFLFFAWHTAGAGDYRVGFTPDAAIEFSPPFDTFSIVTVDYPPVEEPASIDPLPDPAPATSFLEEIAPEVDTVQLDYTMLEDDTAFVNLKPLNSSAAGKGMVSVDDILNNEESAYIAMRYLDYEGIRYVLCPLTFTLMPAKSCEYPLFSYNQGNGLKVIGRVPTADLLHGMQSDLPSVFIPLTSGPRSAYMRIEGAPGASGYPQDMTSAVHIETSAGVPGDPVEGNAGAEASAVASSEITGNALYEHRGERSTEIIDSVNFNTGILSVNQASGHLNVQSNTRFVSLSQHGAGVVHLQADRHDVARDNEVHSSHMTHSNLIQDSWCNTTGIMGINQSAGSLNRQSNTVLIALGGSVMLTDAELYATRASTPGKAEEIREGSNIIKDSFIDSRGVIQVHQTCGYQNSVGNHFAMSVREVTLR